MRLRLQISNKSRGGNLPETRKRWKRSLPLAMAVSTVGTIAAGLIAHAQDAGSNEDNFTEAFRELKRNDSLQFDLTTAPPPPEAPKWLDAFFDFIATIFQIIGPILYWLFWLGLGALIVGFLYLIVTTLMAANFSKKDKSAEDTAPPLYQPEQARARILLDEIDALAAQGKYAEAVHTLLFRSIQDIDANRPNVIRRSLTSREIGELTILTSNARGVFSNIASIVERSFFGGQDIGQADFDTARNAYANLAGRSGQWAASEPVARGQAA